VRHASPVDVDGGDTCAEGEGGHRSGGVGADAGQRLEVVRPAVRGHHGGGAAQRERAAVVAQPAPERQHLRRLRRGQCRRIGKPLQEPLVVGDDTGGLGLLEHDLGDEDRVRIAGVTPWERALHGLVPVEQWPFVHRVAI